MESKEETAVRALFSTLPIEQLLILLRQQDERGQALVHREATAGDVGRLATLLAADKTALRSVNRKGETPLDCAAAHLQAVAVQLLCSQYTCGTSRAAAAQQALAGVLANLRPLGACAAPPHFEPTLLALLEAGADLAACQIYVPGVGKRVPLLFNALRQQQYEAAAVLVRHGEAAHCLLQDVQPLHALALGLVPQQACPAIAASPSPQQVLSTAQLLLSSGALVNSACTLETTSIAGLKGATALSYLVHCAPSTSGGAQQAVLSLIDLLLQRGADPNCGDIRENTPLHRLVSELHNCSQEEPPFTALLHRLLQSGATLEATNSTGFTPLGLLLRQGCHSNCMRPATLEAVRALLALGGSVVAAGGGRAWHAVLNAAFLAAWETETRKRLTRELVQVLIEKDDRGSDAGGGSGAGGGRGLNACDFLGMPPLAHLLELALSHMLENGFDAMEVRRVEWQLSPSMHSRLGELVSLLLGSGADPNALDAPRAAEAARVIDATLSAAADSDEEDDILTEDDDSEDEEPGAALAGLQERRHRWCLRRLSSRLAVSSACQAPLRQSIKLHDIDLTRRLLAAGAHVTGLPGATLLEDTADEFLLLSFMVQFKQADRRKVLCWVVDTAEALAAAGAPGFDSLYDMLLPGWTHSWIDLLENLLAGKPWNTEVHRYYPPAFRAAARTLVMINSTAGCAESSPGRARRRRLTTAGGAPIRRGQQVLGSEACRWLYLPPGLLQRIVGLAAGPLSTWAAMEPESSF